MSQSRALFAKERGIRKKQDIPPGQPIHFHAPKKESRRKKSHFILFVGNGCWFPGCGVNGLRSKSLAWEAVWVKSAPGGEGSL